MFIKLLSVGWRLLPCTLSDSLSLPSRPHSQPDKIHQLSNHTNHWTILIPLNGSTHDKREIQKEINCRQNSSLVPLKGMSHEMDLAFDDMHDQFYKGLNSRRDQFLNFLGAQIILYHKTAFLVVNASVCCLNTVMLAACI
jgi:hypothetical protein